MTNVEIIGFLLDRNTELIAESERLQLAHEELKAELENLKSRIAAKKRPALTLVFPDKSTKTIK
jgi:hypothetical protein